MPQRKKYDDFIGAFTALVVEDEPILALDLEILLKSLGATDVHIAATTKDAWELLRSEPFDLCLLDYYLDDGTSGSVAKLIAEAKIPFIFMSGDRDFIVKLRDIDHMNTLQKPFSHKDLKIAVAGALGTKLPESAQD